MMTVQSITRQLGLIPTLAMEDLQYSQMHSAFLICACNFSSLSQRKHMHKLINTNDQQYQL